MTYTPQHTFIPPTIEDVTAEIESHGCRIVHDKALPETMWGGYDHSTKTVYLNPVMKNPRWILATLLHELQHVRLGHIGPQSDTVEREIDRIVAEQLIDPEQYASIYEENLLTPQKRAKLLEVPLWVLTTWEAIHNPEHLNRLAQLPECRKMTVEEFYQTHMCPTWHSTDRVHTLKDNPPALPTAPIKKKEEPHPWVCPAPFRAREHSMYTRFLNRYHITHCAPTSRDTDTVTIGRVHIIEGTPTMVIDVAGSGEYDTLALHLIYTASGQGAGSYGRHMRPCPEHPDCHYLDLAARVSDALTAESFYWDTTPTAA